MNDDYLESLLRAAGRTAAPHASLSPGLAQRVRRLYRRRQRRKLIVAGACLLLLGAVLARGFLVGLGGNLAGPARTSPPVAKADGVRPNDGPGVDGSEIKREEWTVERLLAAERIDQLAEKVHNEEASRDHSDVLDEQLDRVAIAVLLTADRRAKQPGGAERAREDYVLVTQLFPSTTWADEAQKRLKNLHQ